MAVVLFYKSDGFICRSIICNVNSGFGENAIIEGKIALIIVHHSKDNDCYIHLDYLNIYSGVRQKLVFSFSKSIWQK
jgi:hypothetical protein